MKQTKFILMVLLTMLMALLAGCGEKEADLIDLADVSYSGINGKASASVGNSLTDIEALIFADKEPDATLLADVISLEASIVYALDKDENLSNGDKITISVTWDAAKAKACGMKFTGEDKKITVEGLKDAEELDIFADISLEYSGVSPNVTCQIKNNSQNSFINSISFHSDSTSSPGYTPNYLANGDKVIVTANLNSVNADEQGYIVNNTEKIFTVEGQDEYIKEHSQIDQKMMDNIDSSARKLIETKLADTSIYEIYMYPNDLLIAFDIGTPEIIDIKPENSYFLILNDDLNGDESFFPNNNLFMVYSVTAKDNKTPNGKTTYIPVCIKNLVLKNNGEIDVNITDIKVSPDTFDTQSELYDGIVVENKEYYSYQEITQ